MDGKQEVPERGRPGFRLGAAGRLTDLENQFLRMGLENFLQVSSG
jgi:hypothetical protein